MKIFGISMLLISGLFLLGCEDEDLNKIAQAQQCLDNISSDLSTADLATAALKCQEFVSGMSTESANAIKCSAEFIKGGVNTTRITNSLSKLDGGTDNEASYMGALALNTNADHNALVSYCNASGVTGLAYLGSLSYTGTAMAIAAGTRGNVDDANYPSASQANSLLTSCSGDATNCNNATTGQVVYNLKDSYCVGDNSTSAICSKINTAASTTGVDSSGDYASFMNQLISDLNE